MPLVLVMEKTATRNHLLLLESMNSAKFKTNAGEMLTAIASKTSRSKSFSLLQLSSFLLCPVVVNLTESYW